MNTLRLIRSRGERHASITQRLNFAAHATPEATLALVYAHESGLEPDEVRRARRAYGGNTIPAGRCRRAADSVRRACRGRHRDVVRRRHRPGRLQAAGEPRPAHRAGGAHWRKHARAQGCCH